MIADVLAWPLGQIMYLCYRLTGSYGAAIILFAVAIKLILLPLSFMQQKNSIKMLQIQPQVNTISIQYASDPKTQLEEQMALYKKEKYHPLFGLVPTLIQVPIIIGLIRVIYAPLRWLLHIPEQTASALVDAVGRATGAGLPGAMNQLQAAIALQDARTAQGAAGLLAQNAAGLAALEKSSRLDFSFCGFDLSRIPSLSAFDQVVFMAVLSIASTFLLCVLQNAFSALGKGQGKGMQWGLTAFMTLFIAAFSFMVPAALTLYWTVGNVVSAGFIFVVNAVYPPRKYIDYAALEESGRALREARLAQKAAAPTRLQKKQCSEDYKRFFRSEGGQKELVFYSVRGGFYRYYKGLIENILAESDIVIHYVTSDPNDEVFSMKSDRFIPYYIYGNSLIYWFMKLDADIVVMTMPEIEKYYYKRSLVRRDIDYIYVFHAMVSTHMIYRAGAFDYYDTIFCVGPHHMREIRETEALCQLPPKRLVEFGYPLLDDLTESYRETAREKEGPFQVLIAPSHHEGNIMDSCLDALLGSLLGQGWRIVVRPHPQYVKRNPGRMAELENRYRQAEGLFFETDFSTNESQYRSDVMITDWSGISMEYSFATLRPCIYINTPMKVLNPDWEKYQARPALLEIRDQIGVAFEMDEAAQVGETIRDIQSGKILNREAIAQIVERYVYHPGSHGKAGADYIIREIEDRRAGRSAREAGKQA